MASFAVDPTFYLAQNPDVEAWAATSGMTPDAAARLHYKEHGAREGRMPSAAAGRFQGGVRDISVEPLHQWERSGLTSLAGTGDMAAQQYQQGAQTLSSLAQQPTINPMAQPAFEQMQSAIGQGTREFTQADIDRFMNPYQSQVIDRMTQNLTEEGAKAMAKLQAQDVGRSAGSSSRAIQQSSLRGDIIDTLADRQSNLLYQGFSDALSNFGTERGRYMTGAGLYGDLATRAQGVTSAGANTGLAVGGALSSLGMQGIQNQIGAGTAVRNFNQGLVDRTAGALQGQQGYDDTQVTNLLNRLGAIPGNTEQVSYTEPSTLGRIGTGLSGLGDYFNTPTVNNLPWTSPGNVNPGGGYYF